MRRELSSLLSPLRGEKSKMKKEEYIERYGPEALAKQREQTQEWNEKHPEEARESKQLWRSNHPNEVKKIRQEWTRKGGKHYEQRRVHQRTGIPGGKERIRARHQHHYRPYKKIIAPKSQIHHQWIPGTANYTGVALVEKDPHQYGFIDVIQVLEGQITLLTEAEIKGARL